MAWLYLGIAGLLEIVWALGLKAAFTQPRGWIIAVTVAAMVASFALLGLAMKQLPVGSAYAAWTGIGIIGTTIFGMLWYGEPATLVRLGCISLILAGVVGLKFFGASH